MNDLSMRVPDHSAAANVESKEGKNKAFGQSQDQEPSANVWRHLPFPPNKLILKEVLSIGSGEKQPGDCSKQPQSPEITGEDVRNNCGIALSELYPRVKDFSAQVMARPTGKPSFGSATLVCRQNCYYVSNFHVAQDADSVGVFSNDHKLIRYSKVLARDPERDLVLFTAPENSALRPAIGARPASGDKVFTIGHPYGSPFDVIGAGQVLEPSKNFDSRDFLGNPKHYRDLISSDIAVIPGNSGGPEFNARGELVGIKVVAKGSVESGSIPVEDVIEMIDKYEQGGK